MKNKQLYRAAFSHLRSSSEIRWENYQNQAAHSAPEVRESIPRLRPVLARLAAAIAAVCLLTVMSCLAVATNFLGLRDLLLPSPPPNSAVGGSVISMSGLADSPEGKALAEWNAFLEEYDADHAILDQIGNYMDPAFDKYICYLVYTQEMADKLEETAAKYGLKLHTAQADLTAHPELLPVFWTEEVAAYPCYIYEDGTFFMDGDTYIQGAGIIDFQLQRSVRGTLHTATIHVEDISNFSSWNYRAACGCAVTLALGGKRAFLLADLADSVVVAAVLTGESEGLTPAGLEALADRLDLTKLDPVVPPVLPAEAPTPTPYPTVEPVRIPPFAADAAARAAYAAELQSWLDSDGAGSEAPDQFAVYDVDGDGAEELVELFTSGITASHQGQVLSYDPSAPGSWTMELNEYPMFTFYPGGLVAAGASHNQTKGELWPYTLYRFDPAKRVYVELASVYSVSLSILEQVGMEADYPAETDGTGAGIVYYVTPAADGAEEQVMDSAQYEAWLAEIMGGAPEPMELPYLSLTEENIASILP